VTLDQGLPRTLIWATRGRTWGFRFLLDGGLPDPLPAYDLAFSNLGEAPTAWQRAASRVALRFDDPLMRRDLSGRVIPHEFVVSGDLADEIESVEDGLKKVWPLVAEAYARVWETDSPPSTTDLGLDQGDDTSQPHGGAE
jgi:hypothetical protein